MAIDVESFRLYIEGEQVKFIDGSVNLSANKPSTASFTLPTGLEAPSIPRLSLVHLFFLDGSETDPDKAWKFMWEGVVTGFGFNKSSGQSSYAIECSDLWVYMAETNTFFMTHNYFGSETSRAFYGIEEVGVSPTIGSWASKFFVDNSTSEPNDSMMDTFLSFVRSFADDMPLLKFHVERVRFSEKVASIKDNNISKFISAEASRAYIKNSVRKFEGVNGIMDLFREILRISFYNIVNIGPCKKTGDAVSRNAGSSYGSYVLKPNLYYTAPPKCNVLFPDKIVSMTTGRNYLTEATRGIMTKTVLGSDISYFGPSEINEFLNPQTHKSINSDAISGSRGGDAKPNSYKNTFTTRKNISKQSANAPDKNDAFKTFYLDGEIEGLMNAIRVSVPDENVFVNNKKGGTSGSFKENFTPAGAKKVDDKADEDAKQDERVAGKVQENSRKKAKISEDEKKKLASDKAWTYSNYMWEINRRVNNTATLTMKFNPNIVANFQAIVLDRHSPFTGNVASVTHTISAQSASSYTIVNLNLVREINVGGELVDDIVLPDFISEEYADNSKVDSAFETVLGCNSVIDGSKEKDVRISDSINKIMSIVGDVPGLYDKAEDKHAFINEYTKREMISFKDFLDLSGLRDDNGSLFYNGGSKAKINPFDYSAFLDMFEDNLLPEMFDQRNGGKNQFRDRNGNSVFEHKKLAMIRIVSKFKGIVDGR